MKVRGASPSKTRPVFRYPGGKFKQAAWVVSHFPQHKMYCELYGGGGSVLFYKSPTQGMVYNEIDESIVGVFRVLRDEEKAQKLRRAIEFTPYSYKEYLAAYNFDEKDDEIERARKTIFRSFAGIGSDSVFRTAGFCGLKNNETSVTSAQEWARYGPAIENFVARLKNVTIESREAVRVVDLYDSVDTLFYADPPYLPETRSAKKLYQFEMTIEQHEELAERLNRTKGMVVLSGYYSDLYAKLYKSWTLIKKGATAQDGKRRVECLWLSPNIQPRMMF